MFCRAEFLLSIWFCTMLILSVFCILTFQLIHKSWGKHQHVVSLGVTFITKKMLDLCGVSLSEQNAVGFHILSWHTDHACNISNRVCQPGQLHRDGLSFTLKPWAESRLCISIIHAWLLTWSDLHKLLCIISAVCNQAACLHGLLSFVKRGLKFIFGVNL